MRLEDATFVLLAIGFGALAGLGSVIIRCAL